MLTCARRDTFSHRAEIEYDGHHHVFDYWDADCRKALQQQPGSDPASVCEVDDSGEFGFKVLAAHPWPSNMERAVFWFKTLHFALSLVYAIWFYTTKAPVALRNQIRRLRNIRAWKPHQVQRQCRILWCSV